MDSPIYYQVYGFFLVIASLPSIPRSFDSRIQRIEAKRKAAPMVLLSKLRKTLIQTATPHLNFRRHLVGVQKYYSKQEMESSARYLFAVNHSYKHSRFISPDVQDHLALRVRKGSNKK